MRGACRDFACLIALWALALPAAAAEAAAPAPTAAPAPAPPPQTWSQAEVTAARAQCASLLQGRAVEASPQIAFRDGDCGAAAPLRLESVGPAPKVRIVPPALVSCQLAAALDGWVRDELQPIARAKLGSAIVEIRTLSSYDCRYALGRKANRLSEHGRANALDVGAFVTADGQMVSVLEGWGQTLRDAAIGHAAASQSVKSEPPSPTAAPEAAGPKGALRGPAMKGPVIEGLGGSEGAPAATAVTPSDVEAAESTAPASPRGRRSKRGRGSKGLESAAHMTPKGAPVVAPKGAPVVTPKGAGAFLHAAHDSACEVFGTTLGPEANEAHRNHFHIDMAERKVRKICE